MRSQAHAQLTIVLPGMGLHPSDQFQESPHWIPVPLSRSCLTRHRMSFDSQDFILEGRNEACGQAPEASADLPDFLDENLPHQLAPPSQEGTSTSLP
jgi:hypothetical protein